MKFTNQGIRWSRRPVGTPLLFAVFLASPMLSFKESRAQWTQFGGPNRNFMVDAKGLASSWPEAGPKKIWERELGDGYSEVAVDNGVLYTMYRTGDDEFAVALDANTGKTLWESKDPSPFTETMAQFGPGPHTTPVIVSDKVYTIGTNGLMHCFDKKAGKSLWQHDLAKDYGALVPDRGYGNSPIAYKNTIIVAVDRDRKDEKKEAKDEKKKDEKKDAQPDKKDAAKGEKNPSGEGQSLVAFDLNDGHIVWKSQDFEVSYASPILINFQGEEQLVLLLGKGIMAVNPSNGALLWHKELTPEGANLASPLWTGDDLIFCSSAYDSGSRVIKLTKKDGKTEPEELWYGRKMRIHHGNVVRIGDYVYGSSGDFGPAFFMAVNIKTGEVAWRERGFSKATCLLADNKLILLDEDGNLALTTVTPEKLTVISKAKLGEKYAWAAPALAGTKLYMRDRKHIMALELGESAKPSGTE
ncbi:MAG: PQQ-binding-like beta-propeller repeat protein [Planctomycetes bacterium]|nr:PQQ-binding-like beta-propeller repeat protein [Planctomycetota bacterium]MBI3835789.1 PQQ-binding-like beta-propeller repeat protein [Planctomycetota bacterium]